MSDFHVVFSELKEIFKPYEAELVIKENTNENYYLDTHQINPLTKNITFFGSVNMKKSYVSFYLMPIYAYPELTKNISKDLRLRMQGKSCFNFKTVDQGLFEELKELTQKGYEKYKEENLI